MVCGSSTRTAEVSESATTMRPSRSSSRPEGCAHQEETAGPSTNPSWVVPASTMRAPVTGSKVHSWWTPAIAITERPSTRDQVTSHGVDSA